MPDGIHELVSGNGNGNRSPDSGLHLMSIGAERKGVINIAVVRVSYGSQEYTGRNGMPHHPAEDLVLGAAVDAVRNATGKTILPNSVSVAPVSDSVYDRAMRRDHPQEAVAEVGANGSVYRTKSPVEFPFLNPENQRRAIIEAYLTAAGLYLTAKPKAQPGA